MNIEWNNINLVIKLFLKNPIKYPYNPKMRYIIITIFFSILIVLNNYSLYSQILHNINENTSEIYYGFDSSEAIVRSDELVKEYLTGYFWNVSRLV